QRNLELKLKQTAEEESRLAHTAQRAAEERTLLAEAAKSEADRQRIIAVDATELARKAQAEALAQKEECENQRELADDRKAELLKRDKALPATNDRTVVAASGNGVDVSHHNGSVDWVKLRTSGISFAFVKA